MAIWQKLTFVRWPLEGLKVLKIDKLTLICNRETQSDQGKNAFERPILAYIYLVILPKNGHLAKIDFCQMASIGSESA